VHVIINKQWQHVGQEGNFQEKLSINVWVRNVGENLIIGPNVSH
jgi:hypothetical protein